MAVFSGAGNCPTSRHRTQRGSYEWATGIDRERGLCLWLVNNYIIINKSKSRVNSRLRWVREYTTILRANWDSVWGRSALNTANSGESCNLHTYSRLIRCSPKEILHARKSQWQSTPRKVLLYLIWCSPVHLFFSSTERISFCPIILSYITLRH